MKTRILISTLIIFLIANGCDEKNLDKINKNGYVISTFYQNDAQLIAATNAIYASVQSTRLVAREYFFIHDLRSDDMAAGGGGLETPRAQLLNGTSLSPSNQVMNWVWEGFYIVIMRANSVITNGPKATDVKDETLRTRLIAEAKFLRGWSYFELASLWGGVPIYSTYATEVSDTKPRSSEDDVYNFAIADLKDAVDGLPLSYDASNLGRVSKGAAKAILARAYMQRGNYADAKVALQDIINSNQYNLVANYFDNFTEEGEFNKESLWEVGYSNIGDMNWDLNGDGLNEKNIRTQEYSAIGWRNLIPSDKLLDDFERPFKGDAKEDPRLRDNFYFTGDKYGAPDDLKTLTDAAQAGNSSTFNNVVQKISWKKYSMMYKLDPGGFYPGYINQRLIRYAEVLLMMAECLNETDASEANVLTYLNATRLRASVGMPLYPTPRYGTSTKADRRLAIMHEKRVELAGEQTRNRDILRWRKLNQLTAEPISYFTPNKFELLPIPQSEIDNNDKIDQKDQNPGY